MMKAEKHTQKMFSCLYGTGSFSMRFFLRVLRACLNFTQLYFECCFRGYFSGVRWNVAGCVTKYAGKRDRKEVQRELTINLKRVKIKQALNIIKADYLRIGMVYYPPKLSKYTIYQ